MKQIDSKRKKYFQKLPLLHKLDKREVVKKYPMKREALKARERVKSVYGISEKELNRYLDEAFKEGGNLAVNIFRRLEARLDAVVWRLSLAPDIARARLLISHGHVLVNNDKIDDIDFHVRPRSVITLAKSAFEHSSLEESFFKKNFLPVWLERKNSRAFLKRYPAKKEARSDVNFPVIMDLFV